LTQNVIFQIIKLFSPKDERLLNKIKEYLCVHSKKAVYIKSQSVASFNMFDRIYLTLWSKCLNVDKDFPIVI